MLRSTWTVPAYLACLAALSAGACTTETAARPGDPSSVNSDGTGAMPGASPSLPCDVESVLQSNCLHCHGPNRMSGATVSFTSYDALHMASVSVPTQPVYKTMAARITSTDPTTHMPPPNQPQLDGAQLATLTGWLSQGAPPSYENCGSPSGPAGGTGPGMPASNADAGTGPGSGTGTMPPGTTPDASPGAQDPGPASTEPYDYVMQSVPLTADLVIPAGTTVRVGPGVTFTASSGVKIDVNGTLQVEGTTAAPVSFLGAGMPSSWQGIVVESGGNLTLSNVKIGGAQYGIFTNPGSTFSVDHAYFDTSFKAAVVESDGTITNSIFEAVALFPAITEAVSVDDPNGCLTIIDASPTVTNCRFDGSGGLNDMIRIGGNASPVFDHIYVHASHCGFHTNGGTNTSPRITSSVLENLAYGIMAYTTQPIIENSVFKTNTNDVGMCSGATTQNAPKLSNNFYTNGGAVLLDASCDSIGTVDSSPATVANASAGPSGL